MDDNKNIHAKQGDANAKQVFKMRRVGLHSIMVELEKCKNRTAFHHQYTKPSLNPKTY